MRALALTALCVFASADLALARGSDTVIPLDVRIEDDPLPLDPIVELADLQKRIDSGDLPKIQFDFDSAKLQEESYATLDLVARFLLPNPTLKIIIYAHTCNTGDDKYNLELSRRRALAVKTFLVKRGIPPPYIRYKGRGAREPIAPNDTEEGREMNRRIEFRLLRREWSSIY